MISPAPSGPEPGPQAFDPHAADYEAKLMRGLSLSGEGPAYFAAGRVGWVRDWWRRAGLTEPRRIVDYGCGVGETTALLARRFPEARVLGLDPSRRCIERASGRWADDRVRFQVSSQASGGGETADLIYLNGVVHHVPPEERPRLFDDLAGSLAPGGVVALFENNPLNPGTRWVMARIVFDRDAVPLYAREARKRLQAAGLDPISTTYLFYFPRFLRPLRPVERLLGRVPLGAQYGVLSRLG